MLPMEGLRFQGPEGTFQFQVRRQYRHQGKQVARGWGAACKGRGGEGRWSAPGMVQCRGTRRWGTVVGVCLVPEGIVGVVSGQDGRGQLGEIGSKSMS